MPDPQRLRDIAKTLRDQAIALEMEAQALDPPKVAPAPAQAKPSSGLQSAGAFFDGVRATLISNPSDAQLIGVSALTSVGAGILPLGWMAYVLATVHHETGQSYDAAQVENLNYAADALGKLFPNRISPAEAQAYGRTAAHPANQEMIANIIYGGAWGAEHLGNVLAGDGWKYRGRGYVQLTGKANYAKADNALGLKGALLAAPSLIGQPATAAAVAVHGMREGWFTGKKLNDFVSGTGSRDQFINARRIINGTDKADQIAGYAVAFQAALKAGGWL